MTTIGDLVSPISCLFLEFDISKIFNWMITIFSLMLFIVILIIIFKRLNFTNLFSKKIRIKSNDLYLTKFDMDENYDSSISLIKIINLPEWMDVSSLDSETKRQEAFVRQINSMMNFITSCNEIDISFYQFFLYSNETLECFFGSNQEYQLKKLNQILQISFKGIKTEILELEKNPLLKLLNASQSENVFRGGFLSGNLGLKENSLHPFIDQINSFLRMEKKNGLLLISNSTVNQFSFSKKMEYFFLKKRYSNLNSRLQSKKNREMELELKNLDVKLKRLEIKNATKVGISLLIAGEGKNIEQAKLEANSTYNLARTLYQSNFKQDNNFQLDFIDFSKKEIKVLIESILYSKTAVIPDYLELLPEEAALFCRFPSSDTLPISREQKTISQVKQILSADRGIYFGKIISSEGLPLNTYYQNSNDLVFQSLIAGTTGSGKSSTLCFQAINLEKINIKSLIIDPKGTIFATLRSFIPDLQVFNFGNESIAPGRCNILECPDWMDVHTHVNLLENILLSVWQVFPPMNMIIHRALTKLFNSDGWSVEKNCHGKNRTISDLKETINQIMNEMGYSQKTHSDISSAMNMRLDYFIEGQIGTQINCQKSMPIEHLLNKTTIISLEHANSYAEKVVVLTFLGRIFEYFKQLETTDELKHYLIVDEAEHYFGIDQLVNYDDYEKAAAGKASTKKLIEMIAQSRIFGLGIAIATQSPSKLPREILVNCNTKIIHRIIEGYDISVLQKSMRLTEGQANMLPALAIGEVLIMDPINPYPFKLKIDLPYDLTIAGKGITQNQKNDMMIKQMKFYFENNRDLFTNFNKERSFDDSFSNIFNDEIDDPFNSKLNQESLLTSYDKKLLNSPFFRMLFKDTINHVFNDSRSKIPKNLREKFFSDFLDFCKHILENGHIKGSIIEFIDILFDQNYERNEEQKERILEEAKSIIQDFEWGL